MNKLVLGITSPGSVILLKGQAKYFAKKNFKVYLMCPNDENVRSYCEEEGCEHIPIDINRYISPLKDVETLFAITKAFYKIKPDIINVGTPKMGLLGILGGFFAHVPKRIYTCRGFPYENERGLKKFLLISTEKIISRLATTIICISKSIRNKGLKESIFKDKKTVLIGSGSSNGIDLSFFDKNSINSREVENLRNRLNLNGKFVFGFVGRLNDYKGINELFEVFNSLYIEEHNISLIFIGRAEHEKISNQKIIKNIKEHPNIRWISWQKNIPLYMSVFDCFILPSWGEGFGNVLIQAAAMGKPVISTFGTGTRDAVCNGYNGILVPTKSKSDLRKSMLFYMGNSNIRLKHGNNGLKWAQRFKQEIIWEGLYKIYTS